MNQTRKMTRAMKRRTPKTDDSAVTRAGLSPPSGGEWVIVELWAGLVGKDEAVLVVLAGMLVGKAVVGKLEMLLSSGTGETVIVVVDGIEPVEVPCEI